MAFVLAESIQHLAGEFGIDRLGFLTLTFADKVLSIRDAQARFHSLNTHVISKRYRRAIGCWERQKSGRVHFHLVVVLDADIRTGFDFAGIARRDYRSAGLALRSEWAFWRRTAPAYRFGRTELLPVKSTAQGIARYVGKYVSKHIGQRLEQDKGARVIRFIGFKAGDRKFNCRFAWHSAGTWLWRQKLKVFTETLHLTDYFELARLFGPRWAFMCQEEILNTELPAGTLFPSEKAFNIELSAKCRRLALHDIGRARKGGKPYFLKER